MAIVYKDLNLSSPTSSIIAEDLRCVHQQVLAYLNTRKGERLFKPEVGNDLEDFLFDLIDSAAALEVYRRVVSDISAQIPIVSVNLSQTKVEPDPVKGVFYLTLVLDTLGLSQDQLVFTGELSRQAA